MERALKTVRDSFSEDHISRAAANKGGTVLGWIDDIGSYGVNLWELDPLVMRRDLQCRCLGRTFVVDLGECVRSAAVTPLGLGTDDEIGMPTLTGVDLYPNVLEHLADIKNVGGHPYEFYQKLGFSIIGAMPDGNGPGKPNIYI